MSDFDALQLRRLDLTLLLVFEETMAHGKLSAAARRLGLTQSAISHALKRLRDIFGDPLFVRTPRGVRPTPRALALRAPLAEALRLIQGAVRPSGFDPVTDDRLFRIAAPDYETALFAPLLAIPGRGPRLVFRTLIRAEALTALELGDIDLLLGYTLDRAPAVDSETLYEEEYRVVARLGHPALEGALDGPRFAGFDHALVSPGGDIGGVVDKVLATAGLARRVAVAVPYFMAALAIVARTELIATVPRRFAEAHAARFGLGAIEPPMPIRRFPVRMMWARRLGADPGLSWLRARIAGAAVEMA